MTGNINFDGLLKGGKDEEEIGPVWTIQNASYSGKSFDVGSQEGFPAGLSFNSTGTRMFMTGFFSSSVHQYNLTTAFDITSASFSTSFDVSSEIGSPQDLTFNDDGTRMFVPGSSSVYQYNLDAAFDLSSPVTFSGNSFDVSSQDTSPTSVTFNSTGTFMFVAGNMTDKIYQYNLGTAFDVSTASFSNKSFDVSSEETFPEGVRFGTTGTRMFMIGVNGATVYEYNLGAAFDISTASFSGVSFDVSGQDGAPTALTFKDDGTLMFVVGSQTDSVYQYNL